MEFAELLAAAKAVTGYRELTEDAGCGSVGAALLADNGKVYRGVCIDTSSSMGFCAEHAAIAAMLTDGARYIRRVVAVHESGRVLPPCGRCREFMRRLAEENRDAEVMVDENTVVTLRELLPYSD